MADPLEAGTQGPVEQLIDPYRPLQFTDEEGQPVTLTPEEQREYRKQSGLVDPLLDLSAEDMVQLSRQPADDPAKQFHIMSAFELRKDEVTKEPAAVQRVADAWAKYKESTSLADLPSAKELVTNIFGFVKGFTKQVKTIAWNYPQRLLSPFISDERDAEIHRNLAEAAAASEAGLAGMGHLGERVGRAAREFISPKEKTEQDRVLDLFEDLDKAEQLKEVITGKGRMTSEDLSKKLEEAGRPVRPEEIEKMAAGDLLSLFLFGKTFGLVSKAVPGVVSQRALATAGRGTAVAGGKVAEVTGKAAQWVLPKAAKAAPAVGAIKGATVGSGAGSLWGGAALGYGAGKIAAKRLMKAVPQAETLEEVGRQIAGKVPVKGAYAQLAKDVLETVPTAGYELGKGAAFDIGMAATAETPEEARGVGVGVLFGLLGGGARTAGHVISGQLIGPREFGVKTPVKGAGVIPEMEPLHQQSYRAAPDGVKKRVNAVRSFFKSIFPDREFVYVARPEAGQADPLVQKLTELGIPEDRARVIASQDGVSTADVKGRKLIIAREIDAAPHESGHVLEDVLGESVMRDLDALVQGDPKYKANWDLIAQRYAAAFRNEAGERLWNPQQETWQEFILRQSGWGNINAAEKLLFGEGMGPHREGRALELLREVSRQNPDVPIGELWKAVLTPEEQAEVANRYISREVLAENFDAMFKHTGGFAETDTSIPANLARVLGRMIDYVGGEPLAGRTSEYRGYPLSYRLTRQQAGFVESRRAGRPPEAPPTPRGKKVFGPPVTPEQQDEAVRDATGYAGEASATPPEPGAQSPKEVLGLLAEAMGGQNSVLIEGRAAAPGEPSSSISSNRAVRRGIIDIWRFIPDSAKSLVQKLFFPTRVIKTKDGKYMVEGWSPEVLAANAQKFADFANKTEVLAQNLKLPEGIVLDATTRSLTPESWDLLFKSINDFAANQRAGRTGAGEPLVVPKEVTETGGFAPPVRGGVTPVPQEMADFINYLYNFKIPETPIIRGGKVPINVQAQRVSEATLPGRITEPVRVRGAFGRYGKTAKTLEKQAELAEMMGIEGMRVQEVNPFRQAVEQTAQNAGVDAPSLFEVIQHLNVDGIKKVQHAPEQGPQMPANTLTLSAGFQPSKDPRAIKMAAVRNEDTGKVYSGPMHAEAWLAAERAKATTNAFNWTEGFITNSGEFLNRGDAAQRAFELGQTTERYSTGLEAMRLREEQREQGITPPPLDQYQPPLGKRAQDEGLELRRPAVRDINGKIYEADAHWIAEAEAQNRGAEPADPGEGFERGYVRDNGAWVSRDDAVRDVREGRITGFFAADRARTADYEAFRAKKQAEREADQFQPPVNSEPTEPLPQPDPQKIRGGAVSKPAPIYRDASATEGNPWVRRSEAPSNEDRTLLVQISSDLINPESLAGAKDEATQYYDMLYAGTRPGYARLQDFWEIPQWIGFASHFIPNSDVYVVRDMNIAKQFLKEAGYGRVAFSALDTNKGLIRDLVKDYPGKVDIGGYVDPKTFSDLGNVKWHDTMESLAKDMGIPYAEGVNYDHFQGSDVIPRLTMSKGCRHKCAFCSVSKAVEETPGDVILQQAEAIARLGSKLVYLNDKTFGQANNYRLLSQVNERIRAINPDFKGFIVQTTAAQLKVIPAEWLKQSGIKFVELGIESYNDPILKAMRKPATESLINQVTDKLRQANIALIPNIIIGFPQETPETYAKTIKFLKDNKDIISHANIYNLALYKDAELGKQVITLSENDFNENVLEKSFHINPEIHRQFAGDVYGLAKQMLEGWPESAQFQPGKAKELPENVKPIEDLASLEEAFGGMQFLPNKDPRAVRIAAVRDPETGKVYEGLMHADAAVRARDDGANLRWLSHGFLTNEGEFLNREQAFNRGKELGQLGKGTLARQEQMAEGYKIGLLSEDLPKPVESAPEVQQLVNRIEKSSPEDWTTWAQSGRGMSQAAHQAGLKIKSPIELDRIRLVYDNFSLLAKLALQNGNIDQASVFGNKAQAANEIFITATGKGIDGRDYVSVLKQTHGEDYEPPLPAGKPEGAKLIAGQFTPSKNPKALRAAALKDRKSGETFTGTWHGEAQARAEEAGFTVGRKNFIEGFVTNEGEFLTRAEAAKRAAQTNQLMEAGPQQEAFRKAEGIGVEDLTTKTLLAEEWGLDPAQFQTRKKEVELEEHGPQVDDPESGFLSATFRLGGGELEVEHSPDWRQVNGVHLFVPEAERMRGVAPTLIEAAFDKIPKGGVFHPGAVIGVQAEGQARFLQRLSKDTGVRLGDMTVVQFAPKKDEPRAIKTAAVRIEDGTIFTGVVHGIAYDEGIKKLGATKFWESNPRDGFVTNNGEFLSRKAAYQRGIELGQIDEAAYSKRLREGGLSEALITDEPMEAIAFTASRQFLPSKNPRAVKAPAVRMKEDGRIFEDTMWHAGARQKATEAGYRSGYEHGFVTNSGEFLTRDEALQRSVELKQLTAKQADNIGEFHSGDLDEMTDAIPPDRQAEFQFMPAKRKDDWKIRVEGTGGLAGGYYAKAWITPEGKPIQLGPTWHHAFWDQNPDLRKKYKIAEGEKSRTSSLQRGFARINYSVNDGSLTVEATAKAWPKLAPAVRKLVEENLGKIDSMEVSLFDQNVKKVVDEGFEYLFKFRDKEKLDHLPLISAPSETIEVSAQASSARYQPPQLFPSETLDSELKKIRSGKTGGQTFASSGELWEPENKKVDLVSLASVNMPLGQLSRSKLEQALARLSDLLEEQNIVAGVYAFSKEGKPMVSVDLNAVIPSKYRKNTFAFAKENDQVAIWDVENAKEVPSGGTGDTKLQSPGEILDALNLLSRGKPVDVAEIIRENRVSEKVGEELPLPGIGGRKALTPAQSASMTKAEIAEYYPESVIPRRRHEPIPSEITNSPLYKEAASEEEAVLAFSRKMVEFAKEWLDNPVFQSGLQWYSEFAPKLNKVFGKDAPIFAELLAGTSPQQPPGPNFAMALDALEGFKSGRFTKQITKFEEGLEKIKDGSWRPWITKEIKAGKVKDAPEEPTAETFIHHWVDKFNLLPRQSNGKLYSISSEAVLRVLARRWLRETSGLKTQNFVQNLLGTGHEATIDLWADRTMRRIGYSGFKERWRILPKNVAGVSDADFLFSQKVFRKAAEELDLLPDALQGGLWFAEKQFWADQGWSRLDLGDFRKEVAKTEMLRQGIKQREAVTKQSEKAVTRTQPELIIEPRKVRQ